MTNNQLSNLNDEELVHYFSTRNSWGSVIEDDKYYPDYLLMDKFLVFYVYSFAYLGLPAPTRAQLELARFVSDKKNPHRMLMAMRGLSKSLTSQVYTVWRFINNPDEKILVMSAGAARAINYTQFVQKLIKTLPIAKILAPRHNIERTSGQSFDVAGSTASDSPSMYAVGAGNQITGMRASLVIYDDIETAQSVESSTVSAKINTYAMEAQNLLMSGKDESITLCTPHSMSSIYIDWIDKGYKCLIIPAQYPENDLNYFNSLAPYIKERISQDASWVGKAVDERLDLDFLNGKRTRIGKSKYKLQYMLDVSDSDDLRFPLKLSDLIVANIDTDEAPLKIGHSTMPSERLDIKHHGFKQDKLYAPSYTSQEKSVYEYRVMAIDPSGRGNDDTAITIAYSLATKIFLKAAFGISGGYEPETFEKIADLCAFHRIDYLVIESNFGDGSFHKMIEPYIARISPNTQIDEVRAVGQKEVRIITTLEPLMNQHKIIVDKELLEKDYSSTMVKTLTYQLSKITKQANSLRHDDIIDCLAMCCKYLLNKLDGDEDLAIARRKEEEDDKMFDFIAGLSFKKIKLNFGQRF